MILYAPLSLDRSRPSFVLHSFSTMDKFSTIRLIWDSSHTESARDNFNWYNADGNGSVDDSSLILILDKSVPWNRGRMLKRVFFYQCFRIKTHHLLKLTHRVLKRFGIIHVAQIHGFFHGFVEYSLVHFSMGSVGGQLDFSISISSVLTIQRFVIE